MEGHEIVGYEVNADGVKVLLLRSGSFMWSPRKAAENVAVEELRRARHKTQSFLHICIYPKRLKYSWIGKLHKAVSGLSRGYKGWKPYWDKTQHESLIIGVCFPFLFCSQWQISNTPAILDMERMLCRV